MANVAIFRGARRARLRGLRGPAADRHVQAAWRKSAGAMRQFHAGKLYAAIREALQAAEACGAIGGAEAGQEPDQRAPDACKAVRRTVDKIGKQSGLPTDRIDEAHRTAVRCGYARAAAGVDPRKYGPTARHECDAAQAAFGTLRVHMHARGAKFAGRR